MKVLEIFELMGEFMDTRFLITTADERSWRIDRPVLFLGEWCRRYDRRHVWRNLDAETVPYHWDDREQFYRDYLYLDELYEKLLSELGGALNQFHGVEHSSHYWRILIGPWLFPFIGMLFDRWTMIQRAVNLYEIAGVRVLQTSIEQIVPNDRSHFNQLFVEDSWNEAIYAELLRDFTHVAIETIHAGVQGQFHSPEPKTSNAKPLPFRRRVRSGLASVAFWLSERLVRENEAFFIASYLPIKQDLRLQWQLGQIPKIWRRFPAPRVAIEKAQRKWILGDTTEQGVERIVRSMIPKHIPTLYLEGYASLQKKVAELPWPKKPRLIFTSNSYNSDDVFKAWSGDKVESGVPLVIGQHGGGYGCSLWSSCEKHERAIADRYLNWGWGEGELNLLPTGALKLIGRGRGVWDKEGDLLLVMAVFPRYSYALEPIVVSATQCESYISDSYRFVDALNGEARQRLLVRLYMHDRGWAQVERWSDRYPGLRIDLGSGSIDSLIRGSRLFIATYNSTGFLETLGRNIPTIMFWNPNHWELRVSAIPYFDRLKEVGIFHETPESAAAKVAEVWGDVPGWWNQEKIQEAREYFCHRFARTMDNPIQVLKEALTTVKT
jgi:putative transferase (TIGR04331 family)